MAMMPGASAAAETTADQYPIVGGKNPADRATRKTPRARNPIAVADGTSGFRQYGRRRPAFTRLATLIEV